MPDMTMFSSIVQGLPVLYLEARAAMVCVVCIVTVDFFAGSSYLPITTGWNSSRRDSQDARAQSAAMKNIALARIGLRI